MIDSDKQHVTSNLKLPRDSVGDRGRTSRALPTIKWTLAWATASTGTDSIFQRRRSR